MRLPKEKGGSYDAEPHSYAGTDAERCDLLYFVFTEDPPELEQSGPAADLDVSMT